MIQKRKVKSLSRVQLFVTQGHQAPPFMGFSRQEYWNGLPFPSPMHRDPFNITSNKNLPKGTQRKSWLIRKDPDAGKDWRQKEKRTGQERMRWSDGWHHWLDRHEFEEAPGIGDGQGSLACCSPWGHRESDMTERLNWTGLTSHVTWTS